ncbi:MAG: hypothetical protein ACYC7H_08405, partial [Chloroflexota bacterium]
IERPVIWTGQVPPARWFGATRGPIDLVNIFMVAVALVNLYFGTWIISVLVVTAIVMRWWLVRRQSYELGELIEHEVSPKGIRRGAKQWRWEEFSAWTVLKTKTPGALDLVLRGQDGRSHTHITMPAEAQPYVEVLADKRLRHYVP